MKLAIATTPNAKDKELIVPSLDTNELTNVANIARNAVGENTVGKVSSFIAGILLDFTKKLISAPKRTTPANIIPHHLIGFVEKYTTTPIETIKNQVSHISLFDSFKVNFFIISFFSSTSFFVLIL